MNFGSISFMELARKVRCEKDFTLIHKSTTTQWYTAMYICIWIYKCISLGCVCSHITLDGNKCIWQVHVKKCVFISTTQYHRYSIRKLIGHFLYFFFLFLFEIDTINYKWTHFNVLRSLRRVVVFHLLQSTSSIKNTR